MACGCTEKAAQNADSGAVCVILDEEIKALGPLLKKFGLDSTVDGVKQLLLKLDDIVGGLLLEKGPGGAATQGITAFVRDLVKSLLGEKIDLGPIVAALVDVVVKTLVCTAMPLP